MGEVVREDPEAVAMYLLEDQSDRGTGPPRL